MRMLAAGCCCCCRRHSVRDQLVMSYSIGMTMAVLCDNRWRMSLTQATSITATTKSWATGKTCAPTHATWPRGRRAAMSLVSCLSCMHGKHRLSCLVHPSVRLPFSLVSAKAACVCAGGEAQDGVRGGERQGVHRVVAAGVGAPRPGLQHELGTPCDQDQLPGV